MNTINEIFTEIVQASEATQVDGDYRKNGLLYCGKCHTPKQCHIEILGAKRTVGCFCECAEAEYEAEQQRRKQEERMMQIRKLKAQGIQDETIRGYVFESAEPSASIERCKRYVEHWRAMRENNTGLLLWGGVGTGKTFAAACIANALMDKCVPVLVTSIAKILNSGWNDKAEIIDQTHEFSLLVLDDLGAERDSDYAHETVFTVINERYKSGKPLIITTNITLEELKHPKNQSLNRIYDRILEMCVPVCFEGESRREEEAKRKMRLAMELLV